MRKLALLVALALAAFLANVAIAGDYHVGRSLVCSDCHIAHGSQKHGYATDADTTWLGPHATDPPYPYLLRGETVSNACLNCHDGKAGIPDVLQSPTDLPPNGRSAGALNVGAGGHGYSQVAGYSSGNGHTLWSADAPPGWNGVGSAPGTAPLISEHGLECTDCHRPHGNKYFRNMMGTTATSTATFMSSLWRGTEVTYQIAATPTLPASVWVLEKTANNYDNDNVQYLEKADQLTSEYGKWCMTCHTNFHGNETSANIVDAEGHVVRHPTAGVDATSGNRINTDPKHRLKMMSANGNWAADSTTIVATNDMTPSCFTCHKSHGNMNKFGLVFVLPRGSNSAPAGSPASLIDPTRLATMTEEGDGGHLRDTCRNCHGMGSWPTGNPTNLNLP